MLPLLAACQTVPHDAHPAEDLSVTKNSDELSTDPNGSDTDDPFAPTYGAEVEREALYLIDPVAGSKRLQAVSLHFDEGEPWILHYRPMRGELQYADKRVTVRGRPYTNSPLVQSVMGTHFEMASIALAPGETPWDPVPTEIPAPAQVRTAAELEARSGLWAHCVGHLTRYGPLPGDSFWSTGSFTLEDGTAVDLPQLSTDTAFGDLVGKQATVLGRVSKEGGRLVLHARKICAGTVGRCHMTVDNFRD